MMSKKNDIKVEVPTKMFFNGGNDESIDDRLT